MTIIGKKSKVWAFFKEITTNGALKAQCSIDNCNKQLFMPNMSTTSLRRHLHQYHGMNEFGPVKNDSQKKNLQNVPIVVKKKLDQLIIEAIAQDARTFSDFTKPGIKKLLHYAVPGM